MRVDARALDDALGRLKTVLGRGRGLPPVMDCVLMDAGETSVTLTATNNEQWREIRVPVIGEAPVFTRCVDLARLLALMSRLEGEVEITPKGNLLRVVSGRSRYSFGTIEAAEFPVPPRLAEGTTKFIEHDGDALLEALRFGGFCPDQKERGEGLAGVFLVGEYVFSTDRYRIAAMKSALRWPWKELILPAMGSEGLAEIIEIGDTVKVGASQSILVAETPRAKLTQRLFACNVIDLKAFITPRPGDTLCSVGIGALKAALGRMKAAVTGPNESIFKIEADGLVLQGVMDENEDRLDAMTSGAPIKFKVNNDYVLDALRLFPDDEKVTLGVKDSLDPIHLRFAREDFYYIVMPIRP